jgi:hypothetical protein
MVWCSVKEKQHRDNFTFYILLFYNLPSVVNNRTTDGISQWHMNVKLGLSAPVTGVSRQYYKKELGDLYQGLMLFG